MTPGVVTGQVLTNSESHVSPGPCVALAGRGGVGLAVVRGGCGEERLNMCVSGTLLSGERAEAMWKKLGSVGSDVGRADGVEVVVSCEGCMFVRVLVLKKMQKDWRYLYVDFPSAEPPLMHAASGNAQA